MTSRRMAANWIRVLVFGSWLAASGQAFAADPAPSPKADPAAAAAAATAAAAAAAKVQAMPSPKPAPVDPWPTASPAPVKAGPTIAVAPPSYKPVRTGADLNLVGAACTLWKSNQIGMKGDLVKSPAVPARSFWSDPDAAADAKALAQVKAWAGGAATGWYLVRLQASLAGQKVLYQRLVDLSGSGAVVRFTAQSFYPGGALESEAVWKDSLPESATEYDGLGRVARETLYTAGAVTERHENSWQGSLLASTAISEPDGSLRETVAFSYTLDGRIRQTEKTFPDQHLERFIFRYGEEGMDGTWSEDTESAQSWLYDESGRLLTQEDWLDGQVTKRISVTWADVQGSRMASRETEDFRAKSKIAEAFDANGRVVQIDETLKGETVSAVSQEWDDQGNLVLRNSVGPKSSESWSAEYVDKQPVSERYAKNGLTVRVVTRQGDDSIDEIYLGGVLRLRAYFHGADKYKEEDIRDGQVYRTRSYDTH